MKFTAKMGFKTAYGVFEGGNTHDSGKLGIPDSAVKRWYGAGWCDIEGAPPCPEAKPGAQKIKPENVNVGV